MMQEAFCSFSCHNPAIDRLCYKVRYGLEPDNPQLLALWFDMEQTQTIDNEDEQWLLHIAEFRLLLDTFADSIVPHHWRNLCLDHIYRPLSELGRLAKDAHQKSELNSLMHELRVISQFFK